MLNKVQQARRDAYIKKYARYYDSKIDEANIKTFRLDDINPLYFARDLEYLKSEVYYHEFPEMMARKVFVPNFEINPGAESSAYRMYEHVGKAKITANGATDKNTVTVKGEKVPQNLEGSIVSYNFTMQDLRSAQFAGVPLEREHATAAKEALMRLENDIAFNGDETHQLKGFLSNTDISAQAVPSDGGPSSNSPLWANKTAEQILRDIANGIQVIRATTKGRKKPNAIMIAESRYIWLMTKLFNGTATSVLDFLRGSLQKMIPDSNWFACPELETSGTGSTAEFVLYVKEDVTLDIPLDFVQHPVFQMGTKFEVECEMRYGGVCVKYPKGAIRNYGI